MPTALALGLAKCVFYIWTHPFTSLLPVKLKWGWTLPKGQET